MKSKIISELKNGLGFPRTRTRGEVAAQEQLSIFRQAMATSKGELRAAPTTRGEVAAQEQLRPFVQVFATSKGELRAAPTTRGEVAAQEQMRIIISMATGNFVQNRIGNQ